MENTDHKIEIPLVRSKGSGTGNTNVTSVNPAGLSTLDANVNNAARFQGRELKSRLKVL